MKKCTKIKIVTCIEDVYVEGSDITTSQLGYLIVYDEGLMIAMFRTWDYFKKIGFSDKT